ncbi:hypothetical protein [Nonomuraea zeae]|uniref:DNA-binding phage zinc finger domain-containing protein n=1 Tax=Nonomuraea zeae TaxID=1642303 RepID=A0A5S4FA23_9ACTN|nr:hypothetical protein [Nonomuraea zeae]TMR13865.1 hypothetical protein ETD85_57325 [Nonomuraea zeae]
MSDSDFLRVEALDCPMSSCAAPAGLPCRTGRGKVVAQHHTARFGLVPALAKALHVPTPRCASPARPGSYCPAGETQTSGHARIGYARASTVRQPLDAQPAFAAWLDAMANAFTAPEPPSWFEQLGSPGFYPGL